MTDKIGPTFASELAAAGFGEGIAWNPATGDLIFNTTVERNEETGQITPTPVFTPAQIAAVQAVLAAHDPTKTLPPVVPDSATKLGLMRALSEIGKWDAAKAAIASSAQVQEQWDLAVAVKRTDPLTQGIITMLNLQPADVDNLLLRAAALTA